MAALSKDDVGLLLGFIMREKRYLRSRETSFSQQQLNEGKKIIKDALKDVRAACKNKRELEDCLGKKTKRAKLVAAAFKKAKKHMTRKHAKLIVENYATFANVFGRTVKTSALQLDPKRFDRYYEPKKHEYK